MKFQCYVVGALHKGSDYCIVIMYYILKSLLLGKILLILKVEIPKFPLGLCKYDLSKPKVTVI